MKLFLFNLYWLLNSSNIAQMKRVSYFFLSFEKQSYTSEGNEVLNTEAHYKHHPKDILTFNFKE